ncbi:MAG TPA: glucans biosynthesis glucosyltransferase MdoH [Hyphomonadaceae bacterium]|jgi:membrane glycosyltransferase|nr:glucans biosynthesis glucosyltransferase MdoH [Hyphomonadaceae bacterium]
MLVDHEASARAGAATLAGDVLVSEKPFAQIASEPAPDLDLVPPEERLAMPQQPLSRQRVTPLRERDGRWRIFVLAAPALGVTVLAAFLYWRLLTADGVSLLEWLGLGLFTANLAWISTAAATAFAGAVLLLARKPKAAAVQAFHTSSRTAIVFPVRNEHPGRVMAGAQAVHDALARAGADAAFEIFLLSDTNDAELARDEEAAFRRLRASRPRAQMFYRRRTANHGRKAGNIADFVSRWGGRYDYMVVFDADSLMSAEALMELVRRMDASPRTALVQTLPAIVNAQTLFARSQQFAMRAYGQIFGAGLAWWSGGAGNFWGHNAIVRVRAFADHAGLPVLPGVAPLGGPIMSHDFVEAALLRRAGWRVEIAPEITGSYEECPPTLADMEQRDRRWAQGNLQHLSLLGARGFDPVSRVHIVAGVMGYLSAPLWFALVAASVAFAWASGPAVEDAPHIEGGTVLLAITGLVVFSPKLLALAVWAAGRLPGWPRHPRFVLGVLIEAAISAATAPVMMVSQSVAVVATLLGRDAGWAAQRRAAEGATDAVRYALHVAVGLVLGLAVLAHDAGHAAWSAPVALSLALAGPLSAALSRAPRRRSLLWRAMATPEDMAPPAVVRAAMRAGMAMGETKHASVAPRRTAPVTAS